MLIFCSRYSRDSALLIPSYRRESAIEEALRIFSTLSLVSGGSGLRRPGSHVQIYPVSTCDPTFLWVRESEINQVWAYNYLRELIDLEGVEEGHKNNLSEMDRLYGQLNLEEVFPKRVPDSIPDSYAQPLKQEYGYEYSGSEIPIDVAVYYYRGYLILEYLYVYREPLAREGRKYTLPFYFNEISDKVPS